MQVELYRALIAANIPEDTAMSLVGKLSEHVEQTASSSTESIRQEVRQLSMKMDMQYKSLDERIESGARDLKTQINLVLENDKYRDQYGDRRSQLMRWIVSTLLAATTVIAAVLGAQHFH